MKQNIDIVKIASLAGSLLTVAATLLTGFANDRKLDDTVNKKVAEALAKQLENNSNQ